MLLYPAGMNVSFKLNEIHFEPIFDLTIYRLIANFVDDLAGLYVVKNKFI
jgi:hypothetical protein